MRIRESTAANSAHAMVIVTPASGVALQWCATTGDTSAHLGTAGLVAPYWVRLVRSDVVFTTSHYANDTTWTTLGSATIPMTANVLKGLPATSHNDGVITTANIDSLSITP